MSQTVEQERSALDDFVTMKTEADAAGLPMVVNQQASLLVHGAQEVAVRRDEERVLQRIRVLAAGMGDQWFYRFPVKNRRKGTTDYIEGPSIKLANDLARIYGNCEVDCRVEDWGDNWMIYARFIDLETGFSLTRPFQGRKSAGKIGGDDDARRLDMALQLNASKAIRNVVTNALQSFSDFALDEARHSLVDKIGRDLVGWRTRTVERIKSIVPLDRVEAVIGRKAGEWLAPDIARIIAMGRSVSDGMAAVDEVFPPLRTEAGPDTKDQLDQFAGSQTPPPTQAPGEPAGSGTSEPAAPDPALIKECITKLLAVSADPMLSDEDERMIVLENAREQWLNAVPTPFLNQCVAVVAKVIRGELKGPAARKYLEGLKP